MGGVGRVVAGQGSRSSDDGDCYTVHLKDLDMPNTIFDRPDLSAFTRLDDLGLEVTGSACGQTMQCWLAGLLVRTGGVDAADARASRVTRLSGAWRTSLTGGAPRSCT